MIRTSHRLRIHDAIRLRLLRGEIGPDDRLIDHAIAAEMGVSRMPVREALMQLASEGYLQGTSRGFALPELSPDRIAEIFALRKLLEPQAAALAAQACSPDRLADLRQSLAALTEAGRQGDVVAFHRAAERFRNGWLMAVPNGELRGAIQRYSAQVQSVRFATMTDTAARATIAQGLAALLAAFERGDATAAADRMLHFVFQAEEAHACHIATPATRPDRRQT